MDLSILLPALLLCGVGVAMVYSATHANPVTVHLYLKQLFWIGLGVIGLVLAASMNYQVLLDRYTYPLYGLLLALLAVLLAVGQEIAGSRRWLSLGSFGIQPSEFAKIATVLVLAKFLSAREGRPLSWEIVLGTFALTGVPMLLILKEPDLGTALIFIVLAFAMLYAYGVPWKRLALLLAGGVFSSPLIWLLLKDYQRQRLLIFLNPGSDNLGSGYNVIQSKIAVGSGMLLGKGWLMGTQGQLRFVPEHHTDFIFSVLAEEWGFVGALGLLLLFAILLLQSLRVARLARDLAGSLVAVGLTTVMATQVVVNLCVAIGLLPVTGMTLPLISYGGSSLLTTMIMLGILMNVWSSRIVR
jgi:rod shape determining protein RodA